MTMEELVARELPPDYVHKGLEVLRSVDRTVQGHCQGMETGVFAGLTRCLLIWAASLEGEAKKVHAAKLEAPVPVDMSGHMTGKSKVDKVKE